MEENLRSIQKHYDSQSDTYDSGYGGAIYEGEDIWVTGIVKKYLGSRLLDVGCGTGLLLEHINHTDLEEYMGIDISSGMLEKAQAKFPDANFVIGDMHKIPVPDDHFDTIACLYGTFSYSLNPDLLLKEMSRVLRPGGHIIIMPYTLRVKHNVLLGNCARDNDESAVYLSSKHFDLLKQNGFTINEFAGINFLGNAIFPITNLLKIFPNPGKKFIKHEATLFNSLNPILKDSLVNLARHAVIVAEV